MAFAINGSIHNIESRKPLRRRHVPSRVGRLALQGASWTHELLAFQWLPGLVGAGLGLRKCKAGLGLGGPGAV